MDFSELMVILAGTALIILTLWFFFGKAKPKTPAANQGGAYACPMHPWIVSDDPSATCSLCGMQLVQREH